MMATTVAMATATGRPMPTPSERTAAFNAERRKQLQRLSRLQRNAVGEIEAQLEAAAREVVRLLSTAGSDWERKRLKALQREIEDALTAWRTQATEAASGTLRRAWSAGADLTTEPLAAGGVDFTPRLNLRALAALQHGLTSKITGIGTHAINRINSEIAQVLIGTTPAAQAITNVQRILGGSVRRRARGIVYDEVGRAYSRASQDSLSEATTLLPGLKKRWLHSGKRRPRPDHAAAHGQTVPVNDPFVIAGEPLMYPRDPEASAGNTINCGCMSVPVTDGSTWTKSTIKLDPLDAMTGIKVIRDQTPRRKANADPTQGGEAIPLPG
jgi:uncharacterized protein with gpF-like domain